MPSVPVQMKSLFAALKAKGQVTNPQRRRLTSSLVGRIVRVEGVDVSTVTFVGGRKGHM